MESRHLFAKFLVSQYVKERASRAQSQACLSYAKAQPLFCKERLSAPLYIGPSVKAYRKKKTAPPCGVCRKGEAE